MACREDPPCELCGGETVLDRREGHVVCVECATVAAEWTVGEDRFEAWSRVTDADMNVRKRRKMDRFGGMKARVAALVDHYRLGAAVTAAANNVLDVLPPDRLRDRELDAWAVIALACELCKSCRAMTDLAALAGAPTAKLIELCTTFKRDLTALFEDHRGADGVDETLTAMNSLLSAMYAPDAKDIKLAARSHVLRGARGALGNAAFMNLRPDTRARVLLLEHLTAGGRKLTAAERAALKPGNAVRSGLRKLRPEAAPPTA